MSSSIVVFHKPLKLLLPNLRIGLDDVVVNEPLAELRLVPGVVHGFLCTIIIFLRSCHESIAFLLGVRADETTRVKPVEL